MLIKLLLIGVLSYFLYRLILGPPSVGSGEKKAKIIDVKEKKGKNDSGEYIDYEEIE